jgi:hypothetical protein
MHVDLVNHARDLNVLESQVTARTDAMNKDLPIPSKKWTVQKCNLTNNGPNCQTVEIVIRTINGKPFYGTMCPKEAKHGI